jgi:hypothetical protein
VSATLVWDRDVLLNSPTFEEGYMRGDDFIDFGFANLDLFLVRAGQGIDQAVAASTSSAWNVEHIFAQVDEPGNYELQVWIGELNSIDYGLAWWAGPDLRQPPGDHNGDGSFDSADYVAWRKSPDSFGGDPDGYDDWRMNFGSGSGTGGSASVPEPGAGVTAMLLIAGVSCRGRSARG